MRWQRSARLAASAPRAATTASSPTPREPFTSTVSPGASSRARAAAAAAASGAVRSLAAEALRRSRRASAPDRDQQRRRRPRRACAADARGAAPARARPARASRRAPPRAGPGALRRQVLERRAHRHRVGVVAVVDQQRLRRPARSAAPRIAENVDRQLAVGQCTSSAPAPPPPPPSRLRSWWRLREGRAAAQVLLAVADHDPRRRGPRPASVTSPPSSPNVTRRRSARRCAREQRLSRTAPPRCCAGAQPGDQLGLRGGDRLERAEQLEVGGADVDDHPHVGLGDRGQLGDLAGAAHRHLQHQHLGLLAGARGSRAAGRSRCCGCSGVATIAGQRVQAARRGCPSSRSSRSTR